MQKVRIKKIGVAENALADAGDAATYKFGKINEGVSLPVEYEIEGFLSSRIEVGFPVVIARTKRNGVEETGILKTSAVTDVTDKGFSTRNSLYTVELLPEEVCELGGCCCGH